jgi:hypothetical protein
MIAQLPIAFVFPVIVESELPISSSSFSSDNGIRFEKSNEIHSSLNGSFATGSRISLPIRSRYLTESVNCHKETIIIWKNLND